MFEHNMRSPSVNYYKYVTMHVVSKDYFFKISSNFEADASELLNNLEESV